MSTQLAIDELLHNISDYPTVRSVMLHRNGKMTLHFYTRPRKTFESATKMQEWMESKLWIKSLSS